jgi:hypothetical protein
MITLTTPTDLKVLAVLVPRDADDIIIRGKNSDYSLFYTTGYIDLPWLIKGEYKLIGTLHMDNGSPVFSEGFDFSPFLKEESYADSMRRMVNTTNEEYVYSWLTVELPRQADRYLVNPLGTEPHISRTDNISDPRILYGLTIWNAEIKKSWRAAEAKVIKEKLVFVLVKE